MSRPSEQTVMHAAEASPPRFRDHLLRVFRAPSGGLRPERIGLALLAVFIASMIDGLSRLWSDEVGVVEAVAEGGRGVADDLVWSLTRGDFGAITSLGDAIGFLGGALWELHGFGLVLLGLVAFVVLMAMGGIGRACAAEHARGVVVPWPRMLGYVLVRWRSVLGSALFGPVIIGMLVGVMWLLGAVAGLVPLWGATAWVAGGLALPGALIVVVVGVLTVLTTALLPSAVVCDESDTVDAVQRCWAYVIGTPVRWAVLAAVALASVWIFSFVLILITDGAVDLVAVFVSPGGGAVEDPAWLAFWTNMVEFVRAGVVLSVFASTATQVYLALREINDAEDPGDLPGLP